MISSCVVAFAVGGAACGLELSTAVEPRLESDSAVPLLDAATNETAADLPSSVDGGSDASSATPPSIQIAAAMDRACGVRAGALKCWGNNGNGQLGLGDTNARGDNPNEMGAALPVVDLGPGAQVSQVALGYSHSCAVLRSGAVKCWGANPAGELGLGDRNARGDGPGEMGAALMAVNLSSTKVATMLALGGQHSCAILDNGSVKCWGRNQDGQLGLGDTRERGSSVNEMGDSLSTVDLGTGRTAKQIAAGNAHTCAILDNDVLKCWGKNDRGQLGYGDKNFRGNRGGEMGDALPGVDLGLGRTARAIAAGDAHTCALLDDRTVKCWGYAYFGQCGTGDTNDRGDTSAEMGAQLLAVDLGQAHTAKRIGIGNNHTCIVLDNDELRCFGAGFDAQLGPLPGSATSWGWSGGQMGEKLASINLGAAARVTDVAAGDTHTCVVIADQVKCFGKNTFGSLGLGDTRTRGKVAGEMGAALVPVPLW